MNQRVVKGFRREVNKRYGTLKSLEARRAYQLLKKTYKEMKT